MRGSDVHATSLTDASLFRARWGGWGVASVVFWGGMVGALPHPRPHHTPDYLSA